MGSTRMFKRGVNLQLIVEGSSENEFGVARQARCDTAIRRL
jgi:hypothetical protein